MEENIPIQKDIYSSNKFKEVIDTDFSELFNARETFDVEDFFNLYNELFLVIPIEGDLSHKALIRKSQQLILPGKDVKDKEIDNLQSLINDLQKQLLDASQPSAEVEVIKEHPLFPNGSLVARLLNDPLKTWPDLFYMDQGYKRGVDFSGDDEARSALFSLTNYGEGENDRKIPRFPNSVIDNIPNGPRLTFDNINDKWTPSEFLADSEAMRITLDPTDASLNIDKYDGDYGRYRNELEKDYSEKVNYIASLEEKLTDLRVQKQSIIGG